MTEAAGAAVRRPASPRRPPPRRSLPDKARFAALFAARFFLRFHMTVILGLTLLAGLFVTKLFLVAGSTNLALRYGVAVVASYGVFLVLIALWLRYLGLDGDEGDAPGLEDAVDLVDASGDVVEVLRAPGPARMGFEGEGGGFGGGGSSGSWAEGASDGGSSFGFAPDLDELGGLVLILVLGLVAVLIAASGLWLVYAAPALLAEIAFEALLASTLVRGARRAETSGWFGTAVAGTAPAFAGIFLLAVAFGLVGQELCPSAVRAVDVARCAFR